ncbi:hypothetical protein Tco_0922263 [Tanacetum coccineum]|uniref:Uncharacterized protein n=1 Tax=Tanacetum coccineum TaxID=301880 RepID=A0ABQ5D434_9ASTR
MPTMLTISCVPAALFFIIMMFIWSSSTTYISGRIVYVCMNLCKLSNLFCLSATTYSNAEFSHSIMKSGFQQYLENEIPYHLKEKVEVGKDLAIPVLNIKGDSKEVSSIVKDRIEKIKTANKIYSGIFDHRFSIWRIGSSKYGMLLEIVFALSVDQGIIYGVSDEVDTAYSSKTDNGLEFV